MIESRSTVLMVLVKYLTIVSMDHRTAGYIGDGIDEHKILEAP